MQLNRVTVCLDRSIRLAHGVVRTPDQSLHLVGCGLDVTRPHQRVERIVEGASARALARRLRPDCESFFIINLLERGWYSGLRNRLQWRSVRYHTLCLSLVVFEQPTVVSATTNSAAAVFPFGLICALLGADRSVSDRAHDIRASAKPGWKP
jgi:hypothetical protein